MGVGGCWELLVDGWFSWVLTNPVGGGGGVNRVCVYLRRADIYVGEESFILDSLQRGCLSTKYTDAVDADAIDHRVGVRRHSFRMRYRDDRRDYFFGVFGFNSSRSASSCF